MPTISFITIGNELLKGLIVNTNAARVGELLRQQGLTLDRVVTVGDTREAILTAAEQELAHSDIVLMSGGLGPTKDDITKHTLAELFGAQQWVWDAPTVAFLEARFAERGRVLNELTRQQALVPDVCEVVPNRMGTAPGMRFRRGDKQLVSMPGVPFEMLSMMEQAVIPQIQAEFRTEAFVYSLVRISGIPESEAAQRLERIEAHFPPSASLAYLPRMDGIWLETSMRVPLTQAETAQQQVEQIADAIAQEFGPAVYARDNRPLGTLVRDTFRARGLTLAIAESLTGGQVAATLVQTPGTSHYLKGSLTAYMTEIKSTLLNVPAALIETQGVDSEAVAREMARQVRLLFGADIGLATTGLAEADGEKQPHVWMGFADEKEEAAQHARLLYNRTVNIDKATHYLLQFALQKVEGRL